jgi:hypothetical protein
MRLGPYDRLELGEDIVIEQETCGLSGCDEPVGDGYIVVGMDGEGRVQHHVVINICDSHHERVSSGIIEGMSLGYAPKRVLGTDDEYRWEVDDVRAVE